MSFAFVILSALIVAGAIGAVSLRNLVHCALCLVVALGGLAGLYLQLNAEFAGFAQILVYVGAVAILIVFAILLTREKDPPTVLGYNAWSLSSFLIAGLVFACIATAVMKSPWVEDAAAGGAGDGPAPAAPVRAIGEKLMREHVLPLEILGLLLTAAMIGAVIIALPDARKEKRTLAPGHNDNSNPALAEHSK